MNPTELPKSYDPSVEEPKIRERWLQTDPFHVDPNADGKPYCIVIPPPNVTAALHLGHALNNTLQDILIRYHRMNGAKTLWMPGTDHAGIATQTVVDMRLQSEGKLALKDYKNLEREGKDGRTQFIEKVQAWKDEYEADITDQLKLMGCSCDWDRQRFTMDEVCARAVREAFFQLFNDGLIYRGKRLVNWDPATQTALADDEVENEEIDGYFWYMKYPIVDEHGNETGEHATVATTRPETMLGDTAVAVNPCDQKRKAFVGKRVRLPIVNRMIEIIADDYVVLPDPNSPDAKAQFASGFLKVTPAHDPNDWEIGKRHDLDVINVFAPDATISREFGWSEIEPEIKGDEILENLLGMDRYEARQAIVDWFRKNNLLADVKPYRHAVGHSYRSHVAIEPYLSDQWYVRVTDDRLRGAALDALAPDQMETIADACKYGLEEDRKECAQESPDKVRPKKEPWHGRLRFYPERYTKTFQTWHENLRDWCISRQLWWGHRIPVWGLEGGPTNLGPDPEVIDSRLKELKEKYGEDLCVRVLRREDYEVMEQDLFASSNMACCLRKDIPELIAELETLGFQRDPDVLDTWFSSALWPMSTMGWPEPGAFPEDFPEGEALLNTFNPTNVLCTAREIITLWVSRMVMFNTYFRNRLPFRDVFIHAMIQDGEGRKMSKSLGNGVDPRDIIKSKGTDAMRFTLAQMTTQTQDVRMPVEFDETIGANTSSKFESGRRLCNKLWNATRFALNNLRPKTAGDSPGSEKKPADPTRLIDRWILSRLARTLSECENALKEYQFNIYAQSIYDLIWRDFCDWYLEGIKGTVRDDPTQQSILRAVLAAIHRIAHPIMPFITESLHNSIEAIPVQPHPAIALPASDLATTSPWPVINDNSLVDPGCEENFERIRSLVSAIREVRSLHNVPDRRRITFHIADDQTAAEIENAEGVVDILAGLGTVTRDAPPETAVAVTIFGLEHALSDLSDTVDVDTERERLSKRKSELKRQIASLKGRLANENYVRKAPPHLVEETRAQLAEAEAEFATLTARQENAV